MILSIPVLPFIPEGAVMLLQCNGYASTVSIWQDNHFPKGLSLKELQEWVMPLVEEEKSGKFSGNPFA